MFNTNMFNSRRINAPYKIGQLSYHGSSELIINAGKLKGGIIHMSGQSSLSISANIKANAIFNMTGQGNISINGGKLQKATLNMNSTGRLNIIPVKVLYGYLPMFGTGSLYINAIRNANTSLYMSGESDLSIIPVAIFSGKLGLSGSGKVNMNAIRNANTALYMVGDGKFNIIPMAIFAGHLNLSGSGALNINAIRHANTALYMNGDGAFTARGITTELFVSSDGLFRPLGIYVLGDSREELLPGTRDITEEIPGRHGEIDFGSYLRPRILELHVATDEGYTKEQLSRLKRDVAKYLNPVVGTKTLIFADDIEKTYYVKYSGKINITPQPGWCEFTIPYKMSNPFIKSTFEKSHTGSGTIVNEGTFEVPVIIKIKGPATNPAIKIGDETIKYNGTLSTSDTVEIDTDKMTVTFNGFNALANISGPFIKIQPGEMQVTAGNNITLKWCDYWI